MPLSKWPSRFIEGSGPWLLVWFPVISMMTAWGNYDRDLSRHVARAGLQGTSSLRRPSRSRRHSWSYSALWTLCGTMSKGGHQTAEGRLSDRKIWTMENDIPQSRDRSRSGGHQSPLPEEQRQSSLSSPSPPRSGLPSEQLCLHMWDLKLQARTWESRSRVWK